MGNRLSIIPRHATMAMTGHKKPAFSRIPHGIITFTTSVIWPFLCNVLAIVTSLNTTVIATNSTKSM